MHLISEISMKALIVASLGATCSALQLGRVAAPRSAVVQSPRAFVVAAEDEASFLGASTDIYDPETDKFGVSEFVKW